ncbi:MAG: methyltransferase domain-containing protein [Acidobacteriota bacterium]
MSGSSQNVFYGDLAPWWPLISPLEEYEEEATFVTQVLQERSDRLQTILELGSGGGHCAHFMSRAAPMTLVDLSPGMLAVSEKLNPDCRHLEGDMRTFRIDETFDAVFVHDAIDYMTSEADLQAAFATAHAHLRAGGVALFLPDDLRETFEPGEGCSGSDAEDGRGARLLEWSWDPDPSDTWVQTEYSFVLREADGTVHSVHESHRTGLFPREFWRSSLESAGFAVDRITEPVDAREQGESHPRELFVATKR